MLYIAVISLEDKELQMTF